MNDFDVKEYNSVVLGALLHDVGKFLQRGHSETLDTKGKHPMVSSKFVASFKGFFSRFAIPDLLETLVQRHHENPMMGDDLVCQNAPKEYKSLSYLLSRADYYSSSERGIYSKKRQHYKTTPLVSIFSQLTIDENPRPEKQRYRLRPLSPDKAFPDKFEKYAKGEVSSHLKDFEDDLYELMDNIKSNDFDVLFSQLYNLLMRYAWCLPSDTQVEISDVSLFDHLKTTAAIAACLYQYHYPDFKENEIKDDKGAKFILIIADLSGIQNYIFNITNIGAGGAAKRLRARSLQLSIIMEVISHRILHEFKLPMCNVLMSSGGKCYILLPNLQNIKDTVNQETILLSTEKILVQLRHEIDKWFHGCFNGEINLNMESMPLSGKDFKRFGKVVDDINSKLQKTKKQSFQGVIIDNGSWAVPEFIIDIDFKDEEKLCKACKKFPGQEREDGKVFCDRCNADKEIGTSLPRTKYISFYKTDYGKFDTFCNYSFDLILENMEIKGSPYLVLSMDGSNPDFNRPVFNKYIANYVPGFRDEYQCEECDDDNCNERDEKRTGQIMYFNCIANQAAGRKMLGYIKGDVDSLGRIFKDGFGDYNTVSRVATLSRLLDLFFSGYMQYLMEEKYKDVYTVYSGGDDVLVIGPWNNVVKFAEELNREFSRYVCGNKSVTLSSGMSLVKPKSPVFRSVEWADISLDASKDMPGKDSLTLFGQTVTWENVPDIIKEAEKLQRWLADGRVSTGFVRNLLQYAQWYKLYEKEKNTTYLRYLPLMTYDIARNLPLPSDPDSENHKIRLWAEELKTDINGMMCHLGIIANYALTANRGG